MVVVGGLRSQQFTYGVICEEFFCSESLQKFCGKFAEIFRKEYVLLRQERVRKFRGNSPESLRTFCGNLRKIFCNDPFPKDPISEFLKKAERHLAESTAPLVHVLSAEIRTTFPPKTKALFFLGNRAERRN